MIFFCLCQFFMGFYFSVYIVCRLYVVTSTPMDEDENVSSSNDDVVDCDHDRVDDDDDNNVTDDDSHSNLRRNNRNNENHLALIEAKTNDEFVDEHNNNDTKNGVEGNLSDVDFVVPLSPLVQVMKMDCSSDDENNSSIDERNNILNDSQGTRRNNNGDTSSTYDENNIEISSLNNNNNNTMKKCCANSSDEDESSSDNDDSDSACSDDDVSSPPCVRCKRKRKLTDGSDTNGDILFSNKRTCSLSASSTTQQLQGLITVFKNGLSSMNGNVESSSSGNNSNDINDRDNTLTSSDSSTASYVVGSRQQNNLNRTLSCPAIWELTCAS